MQDEVWKDIPGYEGLYQVSNFGRVKSLPKIHGRRYWKNERILKINIAKNGYAGVFLQKNKNIKRISIHRIVARVFLKNYDEKLQVNHKDGNKLNNNVDNLEMVTASENQIHSRKLGLQTSPKGANSPYAKRIMQFDKDNKFICEYKGIEATAKKLGIGISTLSLCLRGKRELAGGYKWRYVDDTNE